MANHGCQNGHYLVPMLFVSAEKNLSALNAAWNFCVIGRNLTIRVTVRPVENADDQSMASPGVCTDVYFLQEEDINRC